jgi:hypothetical protein
MKFLSLVTFIWLLFCLSAQSQYLDSVFYSKVKSVTNVISLVKMEYSGTNLKYYFVNIGVAPLDLWDLFRLPSLDNGKIVYNGMIWISGDSQRDSCFVIIKSSRGYSVEWFKPCTTHKWCLTRKSTKKLTETN